MKLINDTMFSGYVNLVQNYNDAYHSHFMWKYYRNRMEMSLRKIELITEKLVELCDSLKLNTKNMESLIDDIKQKEVSDLDCTNMFFMLKDIYEVLTELPMLLFSCTNELIKNENRKENEYTFILNMYKDLKNTNEDMLTANYQVHELMEVLMNKNMVKRYITNIKLKKFND